jgi:hypothetical protein
VGQSLQRISSKKAEADVDAGSCVLLLPHCCPEIPFPDAGTQLKSIELMYGSIHREIERPNMAKITPVQTGNSNQNSQASQNKPPRIIRGSTLTQDPATFSEQRTENKSK